MTAKTKKGEKNSQEEIDKPVRVAVIDKIVQSIITGLGLITALAWNDAIQEAFGRFLSKPAGLLAKFIYAMILTTAIVLVTLQLTKVAKRIDKK